MRTTYHRYHDPGHSWTKVSPMELWQLGISLDNISDYSYARIGKRSKVSIYLEEDVDLVLYVRKYKHLWGEWPKYIDHYTDSESRIRSYLTIPQLTRKIAENLWSNGNKYDWRLAESVQPITNALGVKI